MSNYPEPREQLPSMFMATITLADGLVIPSGAGAGNVLVSDAHGRGAWASPLSSNLKARNASDSFNAFPQLFRASFSGTNKPMLTFMDDDTMNTVRLVCAIPSAAAYDVTLPDPLGNVSVLYSTTKLDQLTAPTDVTTLDASTAKHGLMPKLADPGAVPMRVYYSGTAFESQAAAVARFTAYTTLHAGLYRVSAYLVDKVNTISGTVTVRVYYTDRAGAQGPATVAATALSGVGIASVSPPVIVYATAGSIIELDTTLGLFVGTYDCYLAIEAL